MKYQLPKVNPWVAAISVFLTVLLAYYSFLGYRYWAATSEVETSTQRIADLQLEMKRSTASRLNSERAQDESERQVQSAQRAFRTFTSESMLLLVSESADESGVVLMSVVVGGGGLFTKDKTTYRSFPVSLNLQANVESVSRFVDAIEARAGSAEVKAIRFAGLDTQTQAQVELVFYALPETGPTRPSPSGNTGSAGTSDVDIFAE